MRPPRRRRSRRSRYVTGWRRKSPRTGCPCSPCRRAPACVSSAARCSAPKARLSPSTRWAASLNPATRSAARRRLCHAQLPVGALDRRLLTPVGRPPQRRRPGRGLQQPALRRSRCVIIATRRCRGRKQIRDAPFPRPRMVFSMREIAALLDHYAPPINQCRGRAGPPPAPSTGIERRQRRRQ